ncbi:uncharacterized protein LOC135480250 [Liolophura sinensis]|uniref:uncharacterized protein LOC135480250 n=1 Tax=Liolophura sinensis TaxID=3198878 RepID=UPI00315823F8
MTWKRRWSVKEPSPLSLPSNQIQFPLRLPRISSRPNLPKPPPKTESHAPFKAHNLGYTILPPIRKESKRDPRMRREKRAYVDRWDANTDVRESDTDEEDHGPTTGLFWDRDDG